MTLRLRVDVKANSNPRNLLIFEEKKKGDVYIRLKSGVQIGMPPNEILIHQDRYSIHPSPISPTYTTVKKTFELKDETKITQSALTNAVKRKTGFAHIFTHRYSDLSAPLYDVQADCRDVIELGDFDASKMALVVGLFVGHPDLIFPANSPTVGVDTFTSSKFRFVVCSTWLTIPAGLSSWTKSSITFPPELCGSVETQDSARQRMVGESPEACMELFQALTLELAANLLESHIAVSPDEDTRVWLQSELDKLLRAPWYTI
ncbi:hypothetical protein [Rhizobium tropici]|uniref:Uncharacterized protein n=1 Tax=Rhizobium tropici TaxID=398 RepID=A0A329YA09_RHITR|nr:hypothetical protein [Rhizobium tropici]RAX40751.1 hypothetical protein DQ393_15380 [Rhizobium tropici]